AFRIPHSAFERSAASRPSRRRAPRRPRGVVLLLVMVVIVLLTFACYTFSTMMLTERRAVVLSGRQIQARASADSGVDAARIFLSKPLEERQEAGGLFNNPERFRGLAVTADEEGDAARVSIVAAQLDDEGQLAGLRFGLENESTRLNLNALMLADAQQENGGRSLLMALPGMTVEIADALLDWIDEDDEPREFGAEAEYYTGLDPPYRPKNGPLESIEELLLVRGVAPLLLFGADANRNGVIDLSEEALLAAVDNGQGTLDRGWLPYISLYGMEKNQTRDGRPRIMLNTEDMELLHGELSAVLPAEWATFIVALRQNGPYNGSGAGEAAGGGSLDLSKPATYPLSQVLDLIGKKTRVQFDGDEEPSVLTSPFPDEPLAMAVYLPRLVDNVTVNPSPIIPGRININQAPRVVLSGIPGMTEETLNEIISVRQFEPEVDNPNRQHETWLLVEGLVTLEEMKALIPFVTAGGDVYRAQVIGYFDQAGASARLEVVLDATTPLPRMLFWRDLSHLGRGYPVELLGVGVVEE
ncbi:MAG: type II secretion system protein GspK, partial [Pirellulales bacterium]